MTWLRSISFFTILTWLFRVIHEEVKKGSHLWEEEDKNQMKEDEFQEALEEIIIKFEGNYKKNNTFNLKSKVQIAKLGGSL